MGGVLYFSYGLGRVKEEGLYEGPWIDSFLIITLEEILRGRSFACVSMDDNIRRANAFRLCQKGSLRSLSLRHDWVMRRWIDIDDMPSKAVAASPAGKIMWSRIRSDLWNSTQIC